MHSSKNASQEVEQVKGLWLQVCRARGTPLPDPAEVASFLGNLHGQARSELEQALLLCLKGQEKHRELAAVSWAAACTRPALLAQVRTHGMDCTGPQIPGRFTRRPRWVVCQLCISCLQ